jgi:spermidine synthase
MFPPAIALASRSDEVLARDVSVLYGVNTFGGVAGSLAGAFILVPWLGLQQTVRLAGVVALAAACLAFVAGRPAAWQRMMGLAATIATGAFLFTLPAWDLNLLASGGYKYATEVRNLDLDLATGLKAGSLVYYKEGAAATVSVRRLAGTVSLAIDGKVDASNRTDMLTQKLLAHLPLLMHPDPCRVCVIGLGSGVTLGAALRHGIERADVIEISREVVEASSFFVDDNGHALEDPRTRLIVSDGRSHLQLTRDRYDVIISEPSNPWMAGVASLFTREFFLAARARLAPGGIICQWAHTYEMADADLRSIAATFASAFPNGTMWLIGEGDVLFIATNDSVGPRIENIPRAWQRPGVAADLANASVFDAFSLLSLYVAGPSELQRYGQSAFIQTDDRTRLEFSGPLGLYRRRENENAPTLRTLLDPVHAPAAVRTAAAAAGALEWRHRGQMLVKAHAYSMAYDEFLRSVQRDPENDAALTGLIEAAGSASRLAEAQRALELLASKRPTNATVRVALARLLAAMGELERAAARAQEVIAAEPQNPRGMELLASIFADAGDVERLRPLVARMQQAHPEREDTWYYAAMASFLGGDLPDAIARARRVVQMNPHHALAHSLIGSASARLGQRDEAREAFRAALEANPQESSTYANLGVLEMQSGDREAAVAYFAESLTLDPHDSVARDNLSAVLAASRRP